MGKYSNDISKLEVKARENKEKNLKISEKRRHIGSKWVFEEIG